jgi:predicted ATPase/class 3 adenylate cyclase
MLFSDVEGSTALLNRLGDEYGEALSGQRAVLRAAIAAWHGREMGTEGDSFYVVFESAGNAVGCCLDAQRALLGYDWPRGVPVRVRMGLHSGEPTRHEEAYIGLDVHRAARIAAAAHGGQVVLSEATRMLAGSRLPAGTTLLDLGFHRLKDIAEPEHLFQLAGPGLADRFPALKTLGTEASLPVPVTPLVGRDDDLDQLCAAIARPGVRLITLTGTGGVGKTRLALAAATELGAAFPGGVYFVPLAAVTDADVMWKTLADSLDVSSDGQVADAVTEYLADRKAMLVLDNLEQLEGAAAAVADLVAGAPRLMIVTTSRRPLHVQGEHEFPVAALELPDRADAPTVAESGAGRLFVQQAQMVRPGFAITDDNAADVAAICRRLDGLPLAIELAAARVKLLAPRALLARLGQSLALAGPEAGRPSRQQTLRNTVAWSYDLLAGDTARVFRQLAVFAGGCDMEALTAVAAPDGDADIGLAEFDPLQVTAELQDVSLITLTEGTDGEPRLGMLETIREFALDRLTHDDDLDAARRRHAGHYVSIAEQARDQLDGPAQLSALDRLEAEHDNLRAALSWLLDTPAAAGTEEAERAVLGLRLVQALTLFWYQHGHATEGRRWLQRAIDLAGAESGAPLAAVMHGLGVLLDTQGEPAAARQLFERSLAMWRELGDRDMQARELNSLGIAQNRLGDLEVARATLAESIAIARELGSPVRLAAGLTNLGQVESAAGNYDRAALALREALTIDIEQGDLLGVALDHQSLALVSLRAGRPGEARELLTGTFDYVESAGNTSFLANILELSAAIAAALGEPLRAACLAGAAEAFRQLSGTSRTELEAASLERQLAPARATVAPEAWAAKVAAGLAMTEREAVTLLLSASHEPAEPVDEP